ncbi:MAG: hypothetical protein IAE67_04310 [Candidatus Competibacteraceae bacterium]|nr:hypothetical protein [Candidatus Competibacteraceae bacterium]
MKKHIQIPERPNESEFTFKEPLGYFDNLPQNIKNRIHEDNNKSRQILIYKFSTITLAASILLAAWLLMHPKKKENMNNLDETEWLISMLETEGIYEWGEDEFLEYVTNNLETPMRYTHYDIMNWINDEEWEEEDILSFI